VKNYKITAIFTVICAANPHKTPFAIPIFQFGQISQLLQVDEKDRKLRKHIPVAGEITEMAPALTCQDGCSTLHSFN